MSKLLGDRRIWLAYTVLIAVAALACLVWPPVVEFTARPARGIVLTLLGALGLLAPLPRAYSRIVRPLAIALLWGLVVWDVLSQIAPLSQPPAVVWPLRLGPLVIGASLWALLLLDLRWQRRALAAVLLPTVCGLALVAWSAPAQTKRFRPQYVAVDSHGTVYISNSASNVIRVFARDGSLRAKLRPLVAKEMGIPGPGFEQPNVTGEPDQLGTMTPGAYGSVTPSSGSAASVKAREEQANFRVCGLALDAQDRLYAPDMSGHVMLRFTADGRLDAMWSLPYHLAQAPGCVAIAGDTVYLLGDTNNLLRYSLSGHPLPALPLPETPRGGLTAAPDGKALFVVGQSHILKLDVGGGTTSVLPIAAPGASSTVYQPVLAQAGGRLLVADANTTRIDVYCDVSRLCGSIGAPGAMPGQFGGIVGVTQDNQGNLYVAEARYAVTQRLTSAGRVTALYWSLDDDQTQPTR